MPENVTAYGATPDDSTDDTDAFIDAANAAQGGTVYVPEGSFRLNSKRWRGKGALHFGPKSNHQPPGTSIVGAGPNKTTIRMEGGHEYNYLGFTYDENSDHDKAEIRDLTLGGNQFGQGPRPNGGTPNGFAIKIDGKSQDMLLENCRLKEWGTTGGLFNAKQMTVRRCSFINNGQAVWQNDDRRGHGLNVSNSASSNGDEGCLVEDCYFTGSSGTSIDNNGGNFTMRRCFSENNQFAVKYNDGTRTTIKNCRFINLSHRGIYTVHSSGSSGRLELQDVELKNTGREAIATRLNGKVDADNVRIENGNTDPNHQSEAIRFQNKDVSIGAICVVDTPHGGVFHVRDSNGSVSNLVREGNADGIGKVGDIMIKNESSGSTLGVDAPSAAEVGVNTGSDSDTTTTYNHTLKVEASSDTTYALTVSGEAEPGSDADPKDTATETSDGSYLLEGVVLSGGTDSFKFNGELLPDQSELDGDATISVDGAKVAVSEQIGDYETPEPGTLDWHEPLNQNFDQISSDVKEIVGRIEELEKRVN